MLLTDQPIKAVLHRPDTSGRIAKWAIELMKFDINFQPRPSIKAQILTDFVVECTISDLAEPEQQEMSIHEWQPSSLKEKIDLPEDFWALYIDGSSNASGAGAGLILINPEGIIAEYALRFEFPATNNGAEYEALVAGLRIAKELGADRVRVFSDSQLVVGQVNGNYEAREERMKKYLDKVKNLISAFSNFDI